MASLQFGKLSTCQYGDPPSEQNKVLQDLVKPHVESFNYFLEDGLSLAVQNIPPVRFALPNGERITLSYKDASIGYPSVAKGNVYAKEHKVYPAECRGRGCTYGAPLNVHIQWSSSSGQGDIQEKCLGNIPIMVKSSHCNLHQLKPSELIRRKEEAEEMGGYFIINGIEKVVRMLVVPRRNYPLALCRDKWKSRGKFYTKYGISMNCVSLDQSRSNLVLHYLDNSTAILSIIITKRIFFVPVMLIIKGLVDVNDQQIYKDFVRGREKDTFFVGCILGMLRDLQQLKVTNKRAALEYLGESFKVRLNLPEWCSNEEAGQYLFDRHICIHLKNNREKYECLVLMIRKLFSLVRGNCSEENPDSTMNHETLLPGHLYQSVLKEKMTGLLVKLRTMIEKTAKTGKEPDITGLMKKCLRSPLYVSRQMEYFLATGNLVSPTGLGLLQTAGFAVVADKLNFMRYLSHFRCLHRGSFFVEMRSTTARKLLPEAWGFLCPVHTPDGTPCGLLNHLTASCQVTTFQPKTDGLVQTLHSLGMVALDEPFITEEDCYEVVLDGRVIGILPKDGADIVVANLRVLKSKGEQGIPKTLEITLIPITGKTTQYPGLFLFTSPARLIRPVTNLMTGEDELVGTMEQVYLDIAVTPKEAIPEVTTHMEKSEDSILSVAASLTPFSDFNQSPRNMYQCQMGKQTMGTPSHVLPYRIDHKMYQLQTVQSPVVRPKSYDTVDMDNYPLGTNAIVAVISYTGYDMEDAMVLNKSSVERGFAHGQIYTTEIADLQQHRKGPYRNEIIYTFGCDPTDPRAKGKLDSDGLPPPGTILEPSDPLYGYIEISTGQKLFGKYKGSEKGIVSSVKVVGNDLGTEVSQKAYIQLKIQRNPSIGDKFSSRHGQKGVCSLKCPQPDMPFTESGMTPDIIFNPHGFPSRMTIGMMIESMAGKSACLHGLCHDATPFTFSEKNTAIEYFGKCLTEAGYNYYGTETMYSGTSGVELEAEIFIGVVYYQRLRHMVSDKFQQVRSTGPIDLLTHQPVKGRKRAGGIRFGEMERDSLLAHGTSFLLHDRLMNCSDKSLTRVCKKCGSLLGISLETPLADYSVSERMLGVDQRKWTCAICDTSKELEVIYVPYVFRYLVAELCAMNVKTVLKVK
ncbi:DNA-directed RNA polymerase I subunit RPA2 [Holothuria leucospilota]|uniref:DNA-directed RNA polymerase subunit beta n=1 Tax=Holothuria leucospilota TaxID=206669 RepID=A0A9Q1BFF4_HOLLE|nr:DNA-directed RNA polymerase I subunit RPA2 [Holothuria leucospilota]